MQSIGKLLGDGSDSATPGTCASCGAEVEVEGLAVAAGLSMSRHLLASGQAALTTGELVYCDRCGDEWERKQHKISMSRLKASAQLFAEMRELYGSRDDRERWAREQPAWFRGEHSRTLYDWVNAPQPKKAGRRNEYGGT